MKNNIYIITGLFFIVGLGVGCAVGSLKDRHNTLLHQSMNMNMSMSDMMSSMNADLKGKSGDDFDQAFLSEMIAHHQGAVDMAETALAQAKHQEIKDLASSIISTQNSEIAKMRQWQEGWYSQ